MLIRYMVFHCLYLGQRIEMKLLLHKYCFNLYEKNFHRRKIKHSVSEKFNSVFNIRFFCVIFVQFLTSSPYFSLQNPNEKEFQLLLKFLNILTQRNFQNFNKFPREKFSSFPIFWVLLDFVPLRNFQFFSNSVQHS